MVRMKDITGKRFGKLIAIEPTKTPEIQGRKYWKCVCDCGTVIEVRGDNLRSGNSKQCSYCSRRGKNSREIF